MKDALISTIIFTITLLILATPGLAQVEFIEHTIVEDYNEPWSVCAVDMDGDEDLDVLGSARLANRIDWWENIDNLSFVQHTISTTSYYAMGVDAADFDYDGDIDVVCAAQNIGVELWENLGDQTFVRHIIVVWLYASFASTADVDSDGDTDVLIACCEGGVNRMGWLENLGGLNFSEHIVISDWDHANSVCGINLDGDDDTDLIGTASWAGNILWFENDGFQNFTPDTIFQTAARPSCAIGADLDIDGDVDVVGSICQINQIMWFENNGNQNFTPHVIATGFSRPHSVDTADFNNDGETDVLAGAIIGDKISWLENDGEENFTEHVITANFDGASDVYATDLDGDGDWDILGTAHYANQIKWWENTLIMDLRVIESMTLTDNGNQDGRADPGETCELVIEVGNPLNAPSTVSDVSGELSCDDPAVNLISTTYFYGTIEPGSSSSNAVEPFVFSVSPTEPHFADFTLILTYDQTSEELPFQLELGRPPVLLVDDDGGDDYEAWYIASFDSLDMFVDVWGEADSSIQSEELCRYQAVIWMTGDTEATLNGDEQTALQSYLDAGNSLLLSSKNAGADIGVTAFYANYLQAEFIADSVLGAFMAYGVDGCPFSSSTDSLFLVGATGAGNFQSLDAISPLSEADSAFTYSGESYVGGIYFEGAYKLAYLAFPLETVHSAGMSISRDALIAAIFDWFDLTAGISDTKAATPLDFELKPSYPNPFNARAKLTFTLPYADEISLTVYDVQGREVVKLADGWHEAGLHEAAFDGSKCCSGVYLVRLRCGDYQRTRKIVLLK